MNIENILEKLLTNYQEGMIDEYVLFLRFDQRFNTLREIIYHIDVFLAEKNYEQLLLLLEVSDILVENLEAGIINAADDDDEDDDEENEITYRSKSKKKKTKHDEKKNSRVLKIIAKKKWAKYYEHIGELNQAVKHYEGILQTLKLPQEENFYAEILMEIGILEEQTGKRKEAILKFEEAAAIYKNRGDTFNYLASVFNCAHVYYDLHQYRKAETYCRKVLKHYQEKKKIHSPIAHSYLEMANIYELREERSRAKQYYEKAFDSYRRLNDKTKMSDIMNRIGGYEMEQGNHTSAASTFQQALDVKRTLDFQQGKGEHFFLMGETLRHTGAYDSALEYYSIAYHYYEQVGIEARKTMLKFKIFLCLKALDKSTKDMGSFVEGYENKYPDLSKSMEIQRFDYKNLNKDGPNTIKERGAKYFDRPKVNRKFLIYLLRNLARVYSKLKNKGEMQKYREILSSVEKIYYQEKEP